MDTIHKSGLRAWSLCCGWILLLIGIGFSGAGLAGAAASKIPETNARILAPPPNDQCDFAEVIPGNGPFPYLTTLVPDITDATTTGDPPAPLCGGASRSRSLW